MTAYLTGYLVPKQVMDIWNGRGALDANTHKQTQRAFADLTFSGLAGLTWYFAGEALSPYLFTRNGMAALIAVLTAVGSSKGQVVKGFQGTAGLVAGTILATSGCTGAYRVGMGNVMELLTNLGTALSGLVLMSKKGQSLVTTCYQVVPDYVMPTLAGEKKPSK